jgi:hypothetical protein
MGQRIEQGPCVVEMGPDGTLRAIRQTDDFHFYRVRVPRARYRARRGAGRLASETLIDTGCLTGHDGTASTVRGDPMVQEQSP